LPGFEFILAGSRQDLPRPDSRSILIIIAETVPFYVISLYDAIFRTATRMLHCTREYYTCTASTRVIGTPIFAPEI